MTVTGDLWIMCVAAFLAVFILLSLLAAVMRLLIMAFPEITPAGPDAALVAAVTSAMASAYPGTKITKIEEHK
jgi:hypothetical protein